MCCRAARSERGGDSSGEVMKVDVSSRAPDHTRLIYVRSGRRSRKDRVRPGPEVEVTHPKRPHFHVVVVLIHEVVTPHREVPSTAFCRQPARPPGGQIVGIHETVVGCDVLQIVDSAAVDRGVALGANHLEAGLTRLRRIQRGSRQDGSQQGDRCREGRSCKPDRDGARTPSR